jgi:hypothetical protein
MTTVLRMISMATKRLSERHSRVGNTLWADIAVEASRSSLTRSVEDSYWDEADCD